jgi:hypothetical protein
VLTVLVLKATLVFDGEFHASKVKDIDTHFQAFEIKLWF